MSVNELSVIKKSSPATGTQPETTLANVYVETKNLSFSSMDVLRQFEANMATLEDLSSRLRFMMSEIRSLVK